MKYIIIHKNELWILKRLNIIEFVMDIVGSLNYFGIFKWENIENDRM